MAKINDGGPVFPLAIHVAYSHKTYLSKRDLFAAMAMQGILAGRAVYARSSTIAEAAAEQADALIAELAKEKE